ncbi:MAG: Ig-like domain-containing protein [Marinifilaceae bacterium]|jgi:uncharacterized protein (DUF2141 family)|nr:Ig-like domain-containing protein [Marinifilaceae bacterium]
MSSKKLALQFLYLFIGSIVIYSCANVGYPSGGPKDEEAPSVIKTSPEDRSINFEKGKIEIFFNEFVQLKNINESFIISPPLEKKPIVRLKGKSIFVKIDEKLDSNTTYTLDFGSGIVDNNEGNPLGEYSFCFSTSNKIDSMGLAGNIINAFDEKPAEKTIVMAYKNTNDSVPLTIRPSYIAQTDSAGNFKIKNMAAGKYKLFALVDGNRDYLYNNGNELIAFADSLYTPSFSKFKQIDTIAKDSVVVNEYYGYTDNNIQMRLFEKKESQLYLSASKRNRRQKLTFVFNRERSDSLIIDFIDIEEPKSWFRKFSTPTRDSMEYWITDSNIYKKDTLFAKLNYLKTDSLGKLISTIDTVRLFFKDKKKAKIKKSKKKEEKKIEPFLKFNIEGGSNQDLNKNITFSFDEPLNKIVLDSIKLFEIKDSLKIPTDYKLRIDSSNLLKYNLTVKWKPDTKYVLNIDSLAFSSLYGLNNQKQDLNIKTRDLEYYGKLFLNVKSVETNLIIQLLKGDQEQIIEEKYTAENGTVTFDYLKPDVYYIKVIEDRNNNGKWDTGDYINKIQPEYVHYFRKELKIRSNWELEEDINLK